MNREQERGPGSWTEQDLFFNSGILTPSGSGVQNLVLHLLMLVDELNHQERVAELEQETWVLAQEWGYLNNGEIDYEAFLRDWQIIKAGAKV